MLTLEIWVV